MLAISMNPVSWITDAAGALAGSAGGAVLDGIVSWLEDGVRYVSTAIAGELTGLATVDLGSETAQQMSSTFKWVALVVAVGSIMVSAVMAAVSPEGSLGDTIREIPITLILMAGWFGLMTIWTEAMAALMAVFTTDVLVEGLENGIGFDPGIASFVRALVALMLILFLIVFFVELLVLNHMLTFGVLIGQVAIALRPVRPLRGVSGQMIRNLVTFSVVPALGVASLSLSLGRLNDAGALQFGQALGALAGIAVSVLMPMVVAKFLPLGGQGSSAGRSLIGAGAQVAGTAAMVTGGGAMLAAGGGMAGGGMAKQVVSGAGPSIGGSGSGGVGGGSGGGSGGVGGGSGGGGGASPVAGAVSAATSSPSPQTGASTPAPGGSSPRPSTSSTSASTSPRSSGSPSGSSNQLAASAVASSISTLLERGAQE